MKRFLKYWAIRLLGRDFMSLSPKAIAVCIWVALSMVFSAGEPNEEYGILAYAPIVSFVASGITALKLQRDGEL